jgi:hypothetical protein
MLQHNAPWRRHYGPVYSHVCYTNVDAMSPHTQKTTTLCGFYCLILPSERACTACPCGQTARTHRRTLHSPPPPAPRTQLCSTPPTYLHLCVRPCTASPFQPHPRGTQNSCRAFHQTARTFALVYTLLACLSMSRFCCTTAALRICHKQISFSSYIYLCATRASARKRDIRF